MRGCCGRGGAADRARPRVRLERIEIGAHQLKGPPCRCRQPERIADCCACKDCEGRLSSAMMAAPAASASLTEPKTVEELSSTLLSSLPGHDDLKTGVTSNCFEKLTAYAQPSNPGIRGLRSDESGREMKHAHEPHRHPRFSPGGSPGDAPPRAQSAPLRGARSPPFPSVHTFVRLKLIIGNYCE